ncbi:GIY-YIG nuclease family protein [Rhodanobacter denitrificans]|uniref:GIY-YIG nuclease family protein n=1 Tax=Rhodanobacter denitrificans TaxID=666685 RepID=A0A368KGG8_9GAMM|nr:GIY-YIG nuclease family protein [Rhodanobacter denitrificans]RCS29773.1 GIY-YIG nuclease family protein [Rhodanobacter denitrificans]
MSDADAPGDDAWAVYLLECVDGRVYTGIARDPEQRYAKHLGGKGARFTRANPPKRLLGWVWVASRSEALKLEIAWKRLPREARIAALRESKRPTPLP